MNIPAVSVQPVVEFTSLGNSRYGVDANGRILWRTGSAPWERITESVHDINFDARVALASEVVALRKQVFNLQEILNDSDPGFYGEQLPDGLPDLTGDGDEEEDGE